MKKIMNENQDKKAIKDMLIDIYPYLVIIIVVVLIRSFIITPIRVNGDSMEPTLNEGETMILNKIGLHHGINRYDIVVIDAVDDYIIKRVIGLPGDSVAHIEGKLFINGKAVEDIYSKTVTQDFDEVKLKEDEYFVMGDNREVSKDSRMIGAVNIDQIKGKTNLILFPLSKFGILKHE